MALFQFFSGQEKKICQLKLMQKCIVCVFDGSISNPLPIYQYTNNRTAFKFNENWSVGRGLLISEGWFFLAEDFGFFMFPLHAQRFAHVNGYWELVWNVRGSVDRHVFEMQDSCKFFSVNKRRKMSIKSNSSHHGILDLLQSQPICLPFMLNFWSLGWGEIYLTSRQQDCHRPFHHLCLVEITKVVTLVIWKYAKVCQVLHSVWF